MGSGSTEWRPASTILKIFLCLFMCIEIFSAQKQNIKNYFYFSEVIDIFLQSIYNQDNG